MKKYILTAIIALIAFTAGFSLSGKPAKVPNNQPASEQESLPQHPRIFPIPIKDSHLLNNGENPLVTLVWFGEYGDPLSGRLYRQLQELAATAETAFTISYRHAPPGNDEQALQKALAAEAADKQGKFWAVHDYLYQLPPGSQPAAEQIATALGLDAGRFLEDNGSKQLKARIFRDMGLARQHNITRGPALFINGLAVELPITMEKLRAEVEQAATKATAIMTSGIPGDQIYQTIILQADPPLHLAQNGVQNSRQIIMPRHDFPTFGSANPLIWVYYFNSFCGPFCAHGEEVLLALQKKYGTQMKLIIMPYSNSYHTASHLAAACSYHAMEQGNFLPVFHRLNRLPPQFSETDVLNLQDEQGHKICPDPALLTQYDELLAAAAELKNTIKIDSDPALLINGILLPVIRDPLFFDSLMTQELSLATSLSANGLHGQDLLQEIIRTPPSHY